MKTKEQIVVKVLREHSLTFNSILNKNNIDLQKKINIGFLMEKALTNQLEEFEKLIDELDAKCDGCDSYSSEHKLYHLTGHKSCCPECNHKWINREELKSKITGEKQ